jgi:hypothetical protein
MDWRSSGHFAGICPKRECSERPGLLSSNHIRDLWSRIEPDSSIECLEPGQFEWPANRGVFAQMAFMDDQGRELKSSNSHVDWGKAVSLEMAQSELEKGALRVQLRAVIKSAINPPDPSATSAVIPGSVCSFLRHRKSSTKIRERLNLSSRKGGRSSSIPRRGRFQAYRQNHNLSCYLIVMQDSPATRSS